MQGTRLQNVKAAVHHLIDETSRDDVISIVTFSDRAEVLIPAQHPDDPRAMKALVSTIRADGATAMFAGLRAGLDEIERYRDSRYVNHLVLITDGRTYGDEAQCLEIAEQAHTRGVGISGMGMGEDWNDRFLDDLAKRTGGSSTYISAPATVGRFLEDRIRRLATAYAERTHMIVAPTADVQLQSVIRIAPDPMTLNSKAQPIPLGTLDSRIGLKIMLQFHINAGNIGIGDVTIGRVDIGGEVLGAAHRNERVTRLLTAHVAEGDAEHEPPPELLDALSRLALYQLQDRAREALDEGNVGEATRKLEYLATRLFETGEDGLGQAALHEARRVASTRRLSEEGIKNLKYGTRALLPLLGDDHD
jgi:Ca-activated chloride channel family protein